MRIAICEDESGARAWVRQALMSVIPEDSRMSIREFGDGELLLAAYIASNSPFDVVLLDVDMPGLNGLETARRIRNQDGSVVIAFLTSYSEFAIKGYEVRAFRYILKNEPEPLLQRQLREVVREGMRRVKRLTIVTKDAKYALPAQSILYAEVYNRVVTIHARGGTAHQYYGTLAELEAELEGYSFVRTHKSYLVNLAAIDSIRDDQILLKGGETVYMSRRLRAGIEEAFVLYMAGR